MQGMYVSKTWFLITLCCFCSLAFSPFVNAQEQASSAPVSAEERQRVLNLGANISNRAEAVIDRLRNIATRLEARNNKNENSLALKSEVRRHTKEARDSLAGASQIMGTMDERMFAVTTSEQPTERWRDVRIVILDVKTTLREAHERLSAAYALLADPDNFSFVAPTSPATSSPAVSTSTPISDTGTTSTSTIES